MFVIPVSDPSGPLPQTGRTDRHSRLMEISPLPFLSPPASVVRYTQTDAHTMQHVHTQDTDLEERLDGRYNLMCGNAAPVLRPAWAFTHSHAAVFRTLHEPACACMAWLSTTPD